MLVTRYIYIEAKTIHYIHTLSAALCERKTYFLKISTNLYSMTNVALVQGNIGYGTAADGLRQQIIAYFRP